MTHLLDQLGTSKATLYRDLRLLQEAVFPIAKEDGVGEVRHRLLGEPRPAVQPTMRQVLALRLARRMLATLQGAQILRELDALLPRKPPPDGRTPVVQVPSRQVVAEPSIAMAVEQAMTVGQRIAFIYEDGSMNVRAGGGGRGGAAMAAAVGEGGGRARACGAAGGGAGGVATRARGYQAEGVSER